MRRQLRFAVVQHPHEFCGDRRCNTRSSDHREAIMTLNIQRARGHATAAAKVMPNLLASHIRNGLVQGYTDGGTAEAALVVETIEAAARDLPEVLDLIDEVAALHVEGEPMHLHSGEYRTCVQCKGTWPCPTRRVLSRPPEGESQVVEPVGGEL